MQAGKSGLAGDVNREANSFETHDLKNENFDLELLVAKQSLHIRALKKNTIGSEQTICL